jgi:polysaccharide deacetylase family protein (PEP-CTERM system associated)
MRNPQPGVPKRHLLTIALEDYFHVGAFNKIIQRGQWYRFETRFEQNTFKTLDLLDQFHIKATFFVLGWVADKQPEIVKEVVKRGHEIASSGYYHRGIHQMTPAEFREDLARSREALERASGMKVLGYRVAQQGFGPSDLWALDILAEEGYAYDSSIKPLFRSFRSEPWRRFAHLHQFKDKKLWEFPLSTWNFMGVLMPIAGGNYFRQLPHTLIKYAVEHWHQTYNAPFVMYFHVWELDPEQPRINAAPLLTKVRHYRNLGKLSWVLADYFNKYSFVGIAEYLGLSTTLDREHARSLSHTPALSFSQPEPAHKTLVSIVIPCFNEELILPYLSNTLRSVEAAFKEEYELRFIFVDDGSADGTWEALQKIFGLKATCRVLRHIHNRGVAAAILTGIRHADTEIVCSIDCDCTYDPHELKNMIPLLSEGVDLVTASPYHPQGTVRNVPTWRLGLSKSASFLYRFVLRQKLSTYTSCFRVYRKSAIIDLNLKERGYLGIAEMIGKLDLQGSKIVEYPATLEVRMLGRSKMKTLKTIIGHLRLLTRLLAMRMLHRDSSILSFLRERFLPDTPLSSVVKTRSQQTDKSSQDQS